jgi:phosphoglycerate dehydrogenase-like enzyme
MRVAFLDPLEARLAEFPQRYLKEHEVLLPEAPGALPRDLESAEAIAWWSYPLDGSLIARLSNLRFLQRIGYFRAHGDASEALRRGLPVSVLPFGVSDRVALHALALTLAVLRKIVAGHKAVLEGATPIACRRPKARVRRRSTGLASRTWIRSTTRL